jgi:hypothetical protein
VFFRESLLGEGALPGRLNMRVPRLSRSLRLSSALTSPAHATRPRQQPGRASWPDSSRHDLRGRVQRACLHRGQAGRGWFV